LSAPLVTRAHPRLRRGSTSVRLGLVRLPTAIGDLSLLSIPVAVAPFLLVLTPDSLSKLSRPASFEVVGGMGNCASPIALVSRIVADDATIA
jgi:hypothetical protein